MNLIIDIGNTQAKIAVFKQKKMLDKINSSTNNIEIELQKLHANYKIKQCIISSVSNYNLSQIHKTIGLQHFLVVDHKTKVPFINRYNTPRTLGVDRIALASAAVTQYVNKNVLVIDCGTCITYDFVNTDSEYLGGAISPGIDMRYKALHRFTANLPLLEKGDFELTGTNTNSSIHSGVLNGVIQEIEGVIAQYLSENRTLTVVLTGGDTIFLAKKLKSTIFANQNFLLEGLNSILRHNLDG